VIVPEIVTGTDWPFGGQGVVLLAVAVIIGGAHISGTFRSSAANWGAKRGTRGAAVVTASQASRKMNRLITAM
jgi:hypothetical protein